MNDLSQDLASINLNSIKVSEYSHKPDRAWKSLNCIKNDVKRIPLDTPVNPNKIRIVCISDTHSRTNAMTHRIPNCDILIHAGDFTRKGTLNEVQEFNSFLATLNHIKHKIVIAGNHDKIIDSKYDKNLINLNGGNSVKGKKQLTNCIYLEDNYVVLYGLKIYGSPWQPVHYDNAFQLERGEEILEKWNKIPNDIDILVTHGPPVGYGDITSDQRHVGCVDLLNTVRLRVKPKYHIFGHVHESYGMWTDQVTTFINASICSSNYKPINEPILIDIDLPQGITKN